MAKSVTKDHKTVKAAVADIPCEAPHRKSTKKHKSGLEPTILCLTRTTDGRLETATVGVIYFFQQICQIFSTIRSVKEALQSTSMG